MRRRRPGLPERRISMVGGESGLYREVSTGANQHGLRRLEGVVLASSWPPPGPPGVPGFSAAPDPWFGATGVNTQVCSILDTFGAAVGSPPGGTPGPWLLLASPGLSWPLLASPGLSWPPLALASSGLSWHLLASPGLSWPPLASPGLSWPLLASPGLSWPLLASPGLSWLRTPCLEQQGL